jgi:hypothetical protein
MTAVRGEAGRLTLNITLTPLVLLLTLNITLTPLVLLLTLNITLTPLVLLLTLNITLTPTITQNLTPTLTQILILNTIIQMPITTLFMIFITSQTPNTLTTTTKPIKMPIITIIFQPHIICTQKTLPLVHIVHKTAS